MNTRIATKSDHKQIQNLLEYDLINSYPQLQWSLEHSIDWNRTIVTENNGTVISCAARTSYELALYGQYVPADYLNMLATAPQHRRQGFGSQTMHASLTDARAKGGVLCFTVPSNYTFFQKYGFRTAYQFKQYRFSVADLPDFHTNGEFSFVTLSHIPYETLNIIYEYYMADKNAYAKRTKEKWQTILEDLFVNFGGKAVLLSQGGAPVGYLLYLLHGDAMYIYEAAYTNAQAQQSLLGFIKNHSMQVKNISMKMPENDLTHLYFCDKRDAVTLCPFATARLVNVQTALQIAGGFATSPFAVSVIDPIIPENNAVFYVDHQTAVPTDAHPDFTTDIGTLTQLFLGFLSVPDAMRLNLISGNAQAAAAAFSKRTNYINMLCI